MRYMARVTPRVNVRHRVSVTGMISKSLGMG